MSQKGQSMIILIVTITIAMLVLTSVIFRSIGQSKILSGSYRSNKSLYLAETGLEFGILKIIRDPNLCSGNQVLNIDSETISINYSLVGQSCKITSVNILDDVVKKVEIQGYYNNSGKFETCCYQILP